MFLNVLEPLIRNDPVISILLVVFQMLFPTKLKGADEPWEPDGPGKPWEPDGPDDPGSPLGPKGPVSTFTISVTG